MDYEQQNRKLVRLNRGILSFGISNVRINKKDHDDLEKHLYKITHLHLQNKGIDILDNLHAFTQLTVLYLYDNRIRVIESLGNCKNLEQLFLQRNRIQKISGLNDCRKLRKLYLGFNEIQILEGLECLYKLDELHIEYQRLSGGERLKMDPLTLDSLSRCLEVLDISGNQLGTVEDFAGMLKLNTIIAKENQIENLDKVTLILTTIPELKALDLQGNPITKYPKYKERIIGYGENIETLDGKEVSRVSRQFMQRFCQAKSKRLQKIVDSIGKNDSDGGSSVTADISGTTPSKSGSAYSSGPWSTNKSMKSPKGNRRDNVNQSTELEFIMQPPKFSYPDNLSPATSFSLLSPSDSVPEFTLRHQQRSEGEMSPIVQPQHSKSKQKKTFPKPSLSKSIIDFKNLEYPELYDSIGREKKGLCTSGMQMNKKQPMKDLPSRIFQKIADKFAQYGPPQDSQSQTQEDYYSYPHYMAGPDQQYPSMPLIRGITKNKANKNRPKSLSWTVMTPSTTGMQHLKTYNREDMPLEGFQQASSATFEHEIITTRPLQFKSPDLTHSFYNLNINCKASTESMLKREVQSQSQISVCEEDKKGAAFEDEDGEIAEKVESPSKPFESHVYQLPPWPHILRNVGSDQPKVTFIL